MVWILFSHFSPMKRFFLIEQKKFFFLFLALFLVLFYAYLYFFSLSSDVVIESQKYRDFFLTYRMFFPLILLTFSSVFFCLLFLCMRIFGKPWRFRMFFLYAVSYGIILALGVDLFYFEARDADFARVFIETFSLPMIYSSLGVMLFAFFLSLFPQKTS